MPGPSALSLALTPRRHARHARPSTAAPVLVAGGMTLGLTVAAGATAGSASAAADASQWDRLAQCESGGRWDINTGNGYYGGLQFNLATWRAVGGSGYPHQASRETQIAMANRLHDARGFAPWPSCSKKLGLRGGGGGAVAAAPKPAAKAAAPAPRAARSRTSAAPAFDGHVLTVADRGTFRKTARAWQQRMKDRGWKITVDGYFGPQSASVAQRFAAQKGLKAAPGTVNAAVFTAAWSLRVT